MTPDTTQQNVATTANDSIGLPAFKAVLWDMDGTLVNSDILHKICVQKLGEEMGKPVSDDLCARALGVSHQYCYNLLTEELGPLPMDFDTWRQKEFDLYNNSVHTIGPRENVLEIAAILHRRGIKQAIFSNNPRSIIDNTIKGFVRFLDNPQDVFSLVVSLDDVPAKPEPDGYLLAAKQLGIEPSECLVIEDSPTGVKAGMAAGCFTVYWPEPHTTKSLTVAPSIIVNDLNLLLQ